MKARIAAVAVFACLAAGAQAGTTPVCTLDNVTGNVSVRGQGVVVQATDGMPLAEGDTILVSSKGAATVTLASGCAITLLGGQFYAVNTELSCEQSIASVQSLMATTQLAQAPVGTGTADNAAAGAGAAANDEDADHKVSPIIVGIGGLALLAAAAGGSGGSDSKASGS